MATWYKKTKDCWLGAIVGIISLAANAQNVGIGTTTPGSRLEVRGTTNDNTASVLNLTSNSGTSRFFVRNDGRVGINETSTLDRGMLTITSNFTNGISGWNRNIYFNNTNHSSITTNGLLFGMHDANKAFYFGDITGTTLNKYVMTIFANTGRVGINTTSPSQLFHVYTNTDMYAAAIGDDANSHLRIAGTAGGATGYSLLQTFTNASTAGGNLILQRDAGNVGIGTASPTHQLHTTGQIRAGAVGNGYAVLGGGNSSSTGFLRFDLADGSPLGYIGWYTGRLYYHSYPGTHEFNGNVGIGTASPSAQLHATGTIRSGGAGVGYSMLYPGTTNRAGYVQVHDPSNGAVGYMGWFTDRLYFHSFPGVHEFNGGIRVGGSGSSYTWAGQIGLRGSNPFISWHNTDAAGTRIGYIQITGTSTTSSDQGGIILGSGSLRATALSGSGSRVLVADPAGTITAVPYSTVGDHLGNHTATTTLNMNAQSISNYAYLTPYGVGGNSGLSHQPYSIYQEAGAWAHPYPDLNINYHTGIKINAYYGYDGIRFYTGAAPATGLAFQIGEASSDHIIGYRYLRLSSGNWFGVAGSAGIYNYQHGQHFYTTNDAAYWISKSGYGMLFQNPSNATMGYIYHDGTNFGLLDSGGSWTVRTNTGVVAIHKNMQVNGNVSITGTMNSTGYKETSDARWKKNVSPIANALGKVMAMRGVNYEFKTKQELLADKQDTTYQFSDRRQIGFIAQEVEKVLPEVVSTDEKGYKTVEYSKVVALLVEAMKEQQKQIETLKAENASLKAQVDKIKAIEARITSIESIFGERMVSMEEKTGSTAEPKKK